MNIAIVNKITPDILNKMESNKIEAIIYDSIDGNLSFNHLQNKYKLIYIFEDVSSSNEFNFNLIRNKSKILRNLVPELFHYGNYDITEAINKDLFWALLRENAIQFQISKYSGFNNHFYYFNTRPNFIKWLALFKRLFIVKNICNEINDKNINDNNLCNKIAFRINRFEVVHLYGNLFNELGHNKIVSFQTSINESTENCVLELTKLFYKNISVSVLKKNRSKIPFKVKLKLLFLNYDKDYLNTLASIVTNLLTQAKQYEILINAGIKKFVLNAGENEGEGNILCLLAKKKNCITYNYMNGVKAKDFVDSKSYFNYWFMPDQQTKDLILSYNTLRPEDLPLTGHLLEEKAATHKYSGTLNEIIYKLKNKKVIVLFTSHVFLNEKREVEDFLFTFTNNNKDVIVLIKKHPSEVFSNKIKSDSFIEIPNYIGNNATKNLFDIFSVAHLTISFSSTISLQSSWFNIPTIDYEKSEEPRLPFVDNNRIFHVNSIEKLDKFLDDYLLNNQSIPTFDYSSYSSKLIASIMNKDLLYV